MLGPIGSDIMAIFRLLSPDAIDEYIVEENVGRIEGSMTASGEDLAHDPKKQYYKKKIQEDQVEPEEEFDVEKQAKIIPLHEYKEKKEHHPPRKESIASESRTSEDSPSGLDSLGILSASQIRDQEKKRLALERSNEDSITVFLLKEREKMRASKQKITEQVALKIYQSSAAVDLDIEQDYDSEEEVSTDMRGILINKKQY